MHQLYFSPTKIISTAPLELVHIVLWELASDFSLDGYRYYIFFFNDYSRYYWIFPLFLKFDVLTTFKNFKLPFEKQFQLSIKAYNLICGENLEFFTLFFNKK